MSLRQRLVEALCGEEALRVLDVDDLLQSGYRVAPLWKAWKLRRITPEELAAVIDAADPPRKAEALLARVQLRSDPTCRACRHYNRVNSRCTASVHAIRSQDPACARFEYRSTREAIT